MLRGWEIASRTEVPSSGEARVLTLNPTADEKFVNLDVFQFYVVCTSKICIKKVLMDLLLSTTVSLPTSSRPMCFGSILYFSRSEVTTVKLTPKGKPKTLKHMKKIPSNVSEKYIFRYHIIACKTMQMSEDWIPH